MKLDPTTAVIASLDFDGGEGLIPSRTQPGLVHGPGKNLNPRFPCSGGGKPLPYEKQNEFRMTKWSYQGRRPRRPNRGRIWPPSPQPYLFHRGGGGGATASLGATEVAPTYISRRN